MKPWAKQIAVLTLLLLGRATAAWAQEAGMSDLEIPADTRNAADGETVYIPGEELKYIPRASAAVVASDSIALQLQDFPMQRAAQRPAEKTVDRQSGKSKDDSILTFNLLYYIIQKYKLQDIID